ncbi:c-type cytochrome [Parvularcula maris]|uniref:C-type cytochrome n=1 Tax=Parvularcula maris TaxID=2965077 RepID=A0A9X2LAS5_9PROT|nr:c-type cytochrome [Parvularcula maris]MCQ8186278.1 c-type cytochrome [Parvularcula maris]
MKDPLFSNKLAGAVLVVLLLFIGLPVIAGTVVELAGGHHGHHYEEENPFGLSYTPYAELVGGGEGQAEEEEIFLGCLLAEADAERGARSAGVCAACHSFDQGGPQGTGPNLWEVVNRDIASVGAYGGYSSALQSEEGAWTYEKLDAYLYDSQSYISGTQMAQKIRKDNKRADILAYLGTLKSGEPAAYPTCEPPAEEGEEMAEGEGETPMEEVAGEAADRVDFEVPEPGEATLPDSQVNNPGNDGYPGDATREQPANLSEVPQDNTPDEGAPGNENALPEGGTADGDSPDAPEPDAGEGSGQ